MQRTEQKLCVTGLEMRIGFTIMLCMVVCEIAKELGLEIQSLAACTGVVMCVQTNTTESIRAGLNRLLGVICGGAVGIAIVLIDNFLSSSALFILLCGIGVVINLLICKVAKLPHIAGRVSCMTLLLVVLVLQGSMRIHYAVGRFVGTLCGAVISVLVACAWELISRKRSE